MADKIKEIKEGHVLLAGLSDDYFRPAKEKVIKQNGGLAVPDFKEKDKSGQ